MFGFGLTVAGIGIGIVFFELVLLIFVILLITFAARAIENRKKPALPEKKAEIAVQAAAIPAQIAAEDNDDEIAAVIAAAVAYLTEGASVITAIRRVNGTSGSAWGQAGRQETMSARQ